MTTPHGLYLPDGTFQSFDAESLTTEIATRQNAGDIFGITAGFLGLLPDPDPILRAKGDDVTILEGLAADDQVCMAMINRKYRVLNQRNYGFNPGTPAGKAEADGPARLLCDRLIQDMERWAFTDILAGLLDAPFYGFTPLELIWRPKGGWWHLVDIIARPPEWFGFNADNAPVWRGAGMVQAEALPPGKFVFARHFPSYKNPYGVRLLSRCLWPVAFKKGGIQFYVKFVEKYGMPWTVGNAPQKASRAEKQDMAADLARMVQDAVAVIPAGAQVQLHTVTGQVGDLHERFLQRWDRAISKVLMGQTLTAEISDKGSYAASDTHKDVAEDMAEADRAMVESALNEVAWIYGQVNAPSALAPVFKYEEAEDLKERAELDQKLYALGVRFKPAYIENMYDLDAQNFDIVETAPPGVANNSTNGAGDFAALDTPDNAELEKTTAVKAQRALDSALEKALPEVLSANAEFCSQLEKGLLEVDSFEGAQLWLADALSGKLEPAALEDALANMMTGAAGFGEAAVKAEGGEG